MILEVVKYGHPALRQKGARIEKITPEIKSLAADMLETMHANKGVGLAAPQAGVPLRLFIISLGGTRENVKVYINPDITPSGEFDAIEEGCLSVPGLRGMVPRWAHVRYTGFDQYGDAIDRTVDGFHARVVQHECDHLWGKLYPMRVRDFRQFGFTEVLFAEMAVNHDD